MPYAAAQNAILADPSQKPHKDKAEHNRGNDWARFLIPLHVWLNF